MRIKLQKTVFLQNRYFDVFQTYWIGFKIHKIRKPFNIVFGDHDTHVDIVLFFNTPYAWSTNIVSGRTRFPWKQSRLWIGWFPRNKSKPKSCLSGADYIGDKRMHCESSRVRAVFDKAYTTTAPRTMTANQWKVSIFTQLWLRFPQSTTSFTKSIHKLTQCWVLVSENTCELHYKPYIIMPAFYKLKLLITPIHDKLNKPPSHLSISTMCMQLQKLRRWDLTGSQCYF